MLFNFNDLFLKKLYSHNKLLFLGIILFATAQLFINFKQGLMATPFMHFGMYSGAFKVQSEISVTELIINGKKLSAADYSATEWDKIIMPADLYCRHHIRDKIFYQEDIKRLLAVFKIPSNENTFYTPLPKDEFLTRYTNLLSSLIGEKIYELKILHSKYQYLQIDNDVRYILINSKDFLEQCN